MNLRRSLAVRESGLGFVTDTVVEVPGLGACRRIDVYDAWRFAQADVEGAFRAWAGSDPEHRGLCVISYRAALDREEQAARVLAAALRTAPTGC